MDKSILAVINWIPPTMGGRTIIPFRVKYGPIIKKKNTLKQFNGSWSAVIINEKFLSDFETVAQINFLVKNSYMELQKDDEFDLYEGNRLVATGKII